jgi:L-ascorbate metabolism protein UlaG (beta-lactamase superfamily)
MDTVEDDLHSKLSQFVREVGSRIENGEKLGAAVTEGFKKLPDAREYFEFDPARPVESFKLRDPYLYTPYELTRIFLVNRKRQVLTPLTKDPAVSREVLPALSAAAAGKLDLAGFLKTASPDAAEILKSLEEARVLQPLSDAPETQPLPSEPGIYRYQHATLLYRSERASVIVDPHFRSHYEPSDIHETPQPDGIVDAVDAVLISHAHSDHFNLPTLLMFPRETPIIVPKVPRSTYICENMEETLKSFGFKNVIAVDWYSRPLIFKDFEITVLPFYGEQLTRTEWPAYPDMWNWGNTYHLKCPQFSSWFLIDSGNDVRGTMADVARRIYNEKGPVDVVLSNLRSFHVIGPEYINAGRNWLVLSGEQISRLPKMKDQLLTLGPKGVAEVCDLAHARYFLAYAHWWNELEEKVEDDDTGLAGVREELTRRHSPTRIVEWTVGGSFRIPEAGAQ